MPIIYPNPLPFSLRVLRAVTSAIKEVTIANGYIHNLNDFDPGDGSTSERVFRGRAWFGEDDPIPMISVLEGTSPADDVSEAPIISPTGEYDWSLLIQGFVQDDPLHPTDPAHLLMADVRRRLVEEKKRFAPGTRMPDPFGLGLEGKNRVVGIRLEPGFARPADDVSSKAYFWFPLILRVVQNDAEPYG